MDQNEKTNEGSDQQFDINQIDAILLEVQTSKQLETITEEAIEDLCDKLNNLRLNLEKEGNFFDADQAKQRLVKMKEVLSKKKLLLLSEKHKQEKANLEKSFDDELAAFNNFWDEKIQKYETESKQLEVSLIEKQKEELVKYYQSLDETVTKKSKESSEVLNTKAMITVLAKSQEYKEAYLLQQKCKKLEVQDQEKFASGRDQKLKNLSQIFQQRQMNELNVLRQKIESGHDELRKARLKEQERLNNKFISSRRSLENSQLQEFNKFEKAVKGSTASSVMLNKSQYSSFLKSSPQKKTKQKNVI